MEQRLIDANKLEEEFGCSDRDIYAKEYIREAPTVFEFPENPTNGDVIQAIFPNAPIDTELYTNYVMVKLDYHTQCDGGLMFDKDWWNVPYKKEND